MDELQMDIVEIGEDALDALFEETPAGTVNANALVGGGKADEAIVEDDDDEEDEPVVKKKSKSKTQAQPEERTDSLQSLSEEDLEHLDEADEDDEDEDEDEKPKKSKKKEEVKVEEEEKPEGASEVTSVLKSTVDYLVEQGIWQDFEGREDMEFTEETYAQLAAEQDKVRVQSMFEEMVDNTGPFGKAIIDFVKSGGNPDEIIDLFKEQKAVEAVNIESADGQKSLIKQYYTDVMGWKPEKAEKYISNLVLSNELENEAEEVKELYGSFYKKEAERLNQEQQEFANKQKEAEVAFENNIRTAVKERKDLSPAEKKVIEESLLTYDQRLPNGKMVNKFYVNFAKMQANPQDYVDLVMFVNDKQKFMQRQDVKKETEAAAKAFSFIKGNGAVSNKKGTSYDSIKKKEKVSDFSWGLPNKR